MLKIFTLGEYKIFYKNKEIKFEHKKTKALLVYLLLNHKAPWRDTLASLLWSNLNIQDALKDISRKIYIIKKNVPPNILNFTHQKDTISLNTSNKVWVDVFEFDNLCEKLEQIHEKDKFSILKKIIELYRGDFLENFFIKGIYEFSDWVFLKQDEFKNKFINILNKYSEYYLGKKEYELAIELAKESLKRESLQEEIHQKLMYLYNAINQKNLAIKQYELCKNLLNKENLAPSGETETLYKEIKCNWLPEEKVSIPSPKDLDLILIQQENPIYLLGRENEFNHLYNCLESIKSAHPKVVFVSGPSGGGKTRLAEDVLKKFTKKHYVLYGICYQFQNSVSFYPFIKAFKDFFKNINYQIPIKGIWLSNLLKLFPEIEEKLNIAHLPVISHKDLRIQLLESFQKLLTNLSEIHPVVFFIDNWQWADEASLELLSYISQNIQNTAILFLINIQHEALKKNKPLKEYLAYFKNNNFGEILSLKNITQKDIMDLFKEHNKENEIIASYLYKHSLGNPLLLNEILNFLSDQNKATIHSDGKATFLFKSLDELPKKILTLKMKHFLEKHFENLTHGSRTLMKIASVLEEDFDRFILEKIWNISSNKLVDCLEELLENKLLKEQIIKGEIKYFFAHDKIKDYVYDGLSHTKKIELHFAAAQFMEENFKNKPQFYNKIAFHYYRGLKIQEALKYYELAAEYSKSLYHHKEAVEYYKKILENTKEAKNLIHLYLKIADTLYFLGDYAPALNFLNKACAQTNEIPILIEILEHKINIFHRTARRELKNEILYNFKKLRQLKLSNIEKIKLDCLYAYMAIDFSFTELKSMIKIARNNLTILSRIKMPKEKKLNIMVNYNYLLSSTYLAHHNYKKAKPFINKAVALTRKKGSMTDIGIIYYQLGLYFIRIENYKKAMFYINKVKIIFNKLNSPFYNFLLYNNLLANIYIRQMDLQQAYYCLDKARNLISPSNKINLIKNKYFFVCYFLSKSDINNAKKYFKEYIELLKDFNLSAEKKCNIFALEAKILQSKKKLSKNDIDKVENLFQKSIANLKKYGYTWKLADTQYELAMFEKSINRPLKFKKYLKEALKNYKRVGNNKKTKQINNLLKSEQPLCFQSRA